MKRVTKRESKVAREFADLLIRNLRKDVKEKYRFNAKLVGSARWNTILKINGKYWDIDYQILLTNNSKVYKENKFSNPTKIKEDFFNYFNRQFSGKNGFKVENSTTAITLINKNSRFSIDFVIIKDGDQIIRRNNNDGSGKNIYTWNKLKKYHEAFNFFENLSPEKRVDLIENHILPRKLKEKFKNDNDPTKLSSCELFIVEVINYVNRM